MKRIVRILPILVLLWLYTMPVYAQAPVINSVTPNATSIEKYGKLELSVDLTAAYINPYDYADIAVRCSFKSPAGITKVVDGFYIQDYTLNTTNGSITPAGTGNFRVRFAPDETGTWEYTLSCTTTGGTVMLTAQTFQCTNSTTPGFIRKNTSNYLGFDNGMQYIPVGENLCWQNTNAYTDYTSWLNKLSDNKANFIRLWMPAWALAFEWKNGSNGFGGLKQYKQTSAYYLDWLVDYCRQKGIYVMLCLNNHGQVSTSTNAEWNDNPYNAANGGPCTNTWDFFTNTTAKQVHKNRLRYIVARYGYSRNIMSWELFNEVEWTDNFSAHKTDITEWHDEMAQYLKSIDVNKHLVTTSYAHDNEDANTWNLAPIDFTQTHFYVTTPNIETIIGASHSEYLSKYNKPTLNGEFGISVSSGTQTGVDDPDGVHIHNSIWATAFSGGMGAAMTWWWDSYMHPYNLYSHYKPLSELLATLPLKDEKYIKGVSSISGGGTADVTVSPGANFGAATAATFTVEAGAVNPGPTQLGSYLYGASYNTQYRNPPSFSVNYPVAGQFKVITGGSTGTTPKINISLDGVEKLNQAAAINSTYTIDVPAGNHTIKVDNQGTDWIFISSYVFTNIGSPLNAYMLKNNDSTKFAGWIHNKEYNWKYLKDHNTTPPAAINGASVTVKGVQNGMYTVQFFNCSTGALTSGISATASNNSVTVPLSSVSWDVAVVATRTSVTGVVDLPGAKQLKIYPNPLHHTNLVIRYELLQRSAVTMELYGLTGNHITTIYSGIQQAGVQTVHYTPGDYNKLSAGVYLVKVQIGKNAHFEKVCIGR